MENSCKLLVVYLLLSVNRSLKLHYFSTKDSGFCRPLPSHIINFNAGEYLLVGHAVSSYVNLSTRDVAFYYLLLGYVNITLQNISCIRILGGR